jgi:hypothetical protein
MFSLATDVQKIIIEFLEPQEIKNIYETCKDAKIMFDELTKHTNFAVDCKRIISDEELKWFKLKNMKLKLLEEYKNIYGVQYWFKNNKLHRNNDLPAVIRYNNKEQYWYQNGLQHRDNDLPAIIFNNGHQVWYKDGLIHRENDLPAIICENGDREWYKNGKKHRDFDLPAVIQANGHRVWYINGQRCIKKYNKLFV